MEKDWFGKESEKDVSDGDITEHGIHTEDENGLYTLNSKHCNLWRTARRCMKRVLLFILVLFVATVLLAPILPVFKRDDK